MSRAAASRLHRCIARWTSNTTQVAAQQQRHNHSAADDIKWVFLGPPGVGKGTYASRVANTLGVAHIAAGDLVRAEIKSGSELGQQMKSVVNSGKLLPDDMVFKVLQHGIEAEQQRRGVRGFILDGFPRTRAQAEALLATTDVGLAVNLSLREEVLISKCLGRRVCNKCGKNYNIADIYLPATGSQPEIVMPPLSPPEQCVPHMEQRADDTEEVVRRRLEVYHAEADPVEQCFQDRGLLLDFEITGGIPETLPRLLEALKPFTGGSSSSSPELKEHTA